MNSIILCEGSTDYILLQYYMREACQWADDVSVQHGILKMERQRSRNLKKESNILTIMAAGGCSRLCIGLKNVLNRNFLANPDLSDFYSKIVIITDRDEAGTELDFIQNVKKVLDESGVSYEGQLKNDCWITCEMRSQIGITERFSILLLIIPFEQTGAMETFLLDAVREDNAYDRDLIDQCISFVDSVDPQHKYLSSRRYRTKAKFDTYFSIRTPAEQFIDRQNILKNVRWERYSKIQTAFQKLEEL